MRSRTRGRLVSAVLFAAVWLPPAPASAIPVVNTIFPSAGAGGSSVIVVVSNGYVDQGKFGRDAVFLFITRMMNSDEFFVSRQSAFTIKTVFNAAAAQGVQQFGISTANRASCNLSTNVSATASAIDAAATAADSQPDLVAVLSDDDSSSFACTTNEHWTYITSGAGDRRLAMAHEMGHLFGGLYDEYDDGHTAYGGLPIDRSNCSTTVPPAKPYWMTVQPWPASVPRGTNPAGCNLSVSGIVRPYATCKMNDYDRDPAFCAVCRREMDGVLNPPPKEGTPSAPTGIRIIKAAYRLQPPPAGRAVRLLVEVDSATGRTRVLRATDVDNARIVQRRVGDYAFAVTENGQTLTTGVLTGDPFQSRIYDQPSRHKTVTGGTAVVVVVVPGATTDALKTRPVQITFYRLTRSDHDPVTSDKLRSYQNDGSARVVGFVAPAALNDAMKRLSP